MTRQSPDPVQKAREQVAALRAALLSPSPEAISACLPALADAAASLSQMRHKPAREGGGIMRDDALALRNELRHAAKLIAHGAALNHAWATLLGAAAGGYTISGNAAPLAAAPSVSLEG